MKNRIVNQQPQSQFSGFYCHQHDQIKASKLRSIFRRIWQWWLMELRTSSDPKIWQTVDPDGNTWWHAYNPATGYVATRESEIEILAWIDQREIGE
jgi:hypothetical protein